MSVTHTNKPPMGSLMTKQCPGIDSPSLRHYSTSNINVYGRSATAVGTYGDAYTLLARSHIKTRVTDGIHASSVEAPAPEQACGTYHAGAPLLVSGPDTGNVDGPQVGVQANDYGLSRQAQLETANELLDKSFYAEDEGKNGGEEAGEDDDELLDAMISIVAKCVIWHPCSTLEDKQKPSLGSSVSDAENYKLHYALSTAAECRQLIDDIRLDYQGLTSASDRDLEFRTSYVHLIENKIHRAKSRLVHAKTACTTASLDSAQLQLHLFLLGGLAVELADLGRALLWAKVTSSASSKVMDKPMIGSIAPKSVHFYLDAVH